MLHQVIGGLVVGVGQVVTVDLGSCRVGPPDEKWGHLCQVYSFGACPPTPVIIGLALLLFCPRCW